LARRELRSHPLGQGLDGRPVPILLVEPVHVRRRVGRPCKSVDLPDAEPVGPLHDHEEPLTAQDRHVREQRSAADVIQRSDRALTHLVALSDRDDAEDRRALFLPLDEVTEERHIPRLEHLQREACAR
jgi:hypothetical protein